MTVLAIGAPATATAGSGVLADRVEEAAFAAFYATVAPALWKYLYFATRSRSTADDLCQEAFARVLASRFRPESDEHFRRYLYKTASHLLADRRRRPEPLEPLLAHDAVVAPETPGLRLDLEAALARLEPRDRQLIYLAHVEGRDHRAMAAALGVGTASVRVLLFRARRRLAKLLERAGGREERSR